MEHVVYLLGAGFSAPLGLPVMRTFLMRSKDMYASEPDRYSHFREVFECINELARIESYYHADLFNIEEILSILEMRDQIEGKTTRRRFVKYIRDVIEYSTPPPPSAPGHSINWYEYPLTDAGPWLPYFYFALSLLNLGVSLDLSSSGENRFIASYDEHAGTKYSIITLNYDRVLELWSQFLTRYYRGGGNFHFGEFSNEPTKHEHVVPLLKLHGSVDGEDIMAPTWNKGVPKSMAAVWQEAHDTLSSANQIRIIGYSLPVADAYIKYLLKSAVVKASNLKAIDVLCRDPSGATEARYKEFIRFGYTRFASADVVDYLMSVREPTVIAAKQRSPGHNPPVYFRYLEKAHEAFFINRNRG
jgi:hypothetical protein